jgi:hypothetical protein
MVSKKEFLDAKLHSIVLCVAVIAVLLTFCWAVFKHKFIGYHDVNGTHVLVLFSLYAAVFLAWIPAVNKAHSVARAGYTLPSSASLISKGKPSDTPFKSADLPTETPPPRSTPEN